MRRNTCRILVVLMWLALVPQAAQATLHTAGSSLNTDWYHMTQRLSFADRSGTVWLTGTQEGVVGSYQPAIYIQRKVYSETYYRDVWEDAGGLVGPTDRWDQKAYKLQLQLTPKVLRRIDRLKGHGPVRLLGRIEVFDAYTQRWSFPLGTMLGL
jgi:hypothetical protein